MWSLNDTPAGVTAAVAVLSMILSLLSLIIIASLKRRAAKLARVALDLQRDYAVESRLADCPSALRFHGIDPDEVREAGLTAQDVAYLVLSINALSYLCDIENSDMAKFIDTSDYRQRMLRSQHTEKVWKFARNCIPEKTQTVIDAALQKYHRHGETKE